MKLFLVPVVPVGLGLGLGLGLGMSGCLLGGSPDLGSGGSFCSNPVKAVSYEDAGEMSAWNSKIAQSFALSGAKVIRSVELSLSGGDQPEDARSVTVTLHADIGGQPFLGIALASATVSSLPLDQTWVRFSFSTPVSLSAGTYWIVVASPSGGERFVTYGELDNAYPAGKGLIWDDVGGEFSDLDDDYLFRVNACS